MSKTLLGTGAIIRKKPAKREPDKSTIQENATDLTKYRRATYYLKPETITALKVIAAKRDIKLTTLVREALEDFVAKTKV